MPGFGLKNLHDPKYDLYDKFIPDLETKANLPSKVDYTPGMPPVQNQQDLGTCVSWGSAKFLEFYHQRRHNIKTLVSARAIYSGAKLTYDPTDLTDDGLDCSQGMDIISQYYVDESAWPSNDATSEKEFPQWVAPVPDNIKKSDYIVKSFNTVNPTVYDLKLALYKHGLVLSGVNFAENWMNVDSTGRLQSSGLTSAGGHCMVICGYNDHFVNLDGSLGAFTWSNQWGTDYGHNGYIYLPYNVDPDFFPTDLFVAVV